MVVGSIGPGLAVLVGAGTGDGPDEARLLATKIANLRIFEDAAGKMNLSAMDTRAEILVVSQFTLYADTRRGRRPAFTAAALPQVAAPLINLFCRCLSDQGLTVATGQFAAMMLVEIHNDGPVTIILDTDDWKPVRQPAASHTPAI
jgi:D-tyrosyl-tRNA(Tyr) deacylase